MDLAKVKLGVGVVTASGVAACSALGRPDLGHDVAVVGAALLAALGMNALGAGIGGGGKVDPVAVAKAVMQHLFQAAATAQQAQAAQAAQAPSDALGSRYTAPAAPPSPVQLASSPPAVKS